MKALCVPTFMVRCIAYSAPGPQEVLYKGNHHCTVSEGCKLLVEGSEPRTAKTGEHVFCSLNKKAEEL